MFNATQFMSGLMGNTCVFADEETNTYVFWNGSRTFRLLFVLNDNRAISEYNSWTSGDKPKTVAAAIKYAAEYIARERIGQ